MLETWAELSTQPSSLPVTSQVTSRDAQQGPLIRSQRRSGAQGGPRLWTSMSYLSIGPIPQLPEVSVAMGLVVKPPGSTAGPHEDVCTQAQGNDKF